MHRPSSRGAVVNLLMIEFPAFKTSNGSVEFEEHPATSLRVRPALPANVVPARLDEYQVGAVRRAPVHARRRPSSQHPRGHFASACRWARLWTCRTPPSGGTAWCATGARSGACSSTSPARPSAAGCPTQPCCARARCGWRACGATARCRRSPRTSSATPSSSSSSSRSPSRQSPEPKPRRQPRRQPRPQPRPAQAVAQAATTRTPRCWCGGRRETSRAG